MPMHSIFILESKEDDKTNMRDRSEKYLPVCWKAHQNFGLFLRILYFMQINYPFSYLEEDFDIIGVSSHGCKTPLKNCPSE